MNEILKVAGLHVHYGMIEAVKGIDFTLEQGRITALLGANGAGKSTTLLALSGLVKASAGSVVLEGVEITNQPTHKSSEGTDPGGGRAANPHTAQRAGKFAAWRLSARFTRRDKKGFRKSAGAVSSPA